MANPEPNKKKRGCFFYGCITVLVLFVLMTVTLILGVRYAISTGIAGLTDDKPKAIAVVELPADEMKSLLARVDAFKDAMDHPTNSVQLVLTAQEFNALIASSPDFKAVKDRVFIQIQDDKVKADLSWPLDDFAHFPLGGLKGRYLVGSASLKVSLSHGQLIVNLDSLSIKGQPLQAAYLTQIRTQNLAQDINRSPKNAAAISKFESIEIKDGQIIIKLRPAKSEDEKPASDGKKTETI